ncbi:MAG TPA: metallophosphoesterase family protein [Candidatus Binatia bacterium]|nr:metallophosphoesterase family protein [Candidatus Binatia bacterium]
MRLLVLSDIHANLEALEACLSAAPAYDRVMNLGDVVGYNASPNEVCARVRAIRDQVVRGNHDRACSGLSDLSEFNLAAAISARWTQTVLEADHMQWLRSLPQGPLRCEELPGLEFVHGSPKDENEYLLTLSAATADFRLPGHADAIFFGHTHLQGGFACRNGKTRALALQYEDADGVAHCRMELAPGERYLINPGSVGQPRDNDWRAAFACYECNGTAPAIVTFWRAPYDLHQAQARILAANLPERLATRLALGR